MVADLVYGAADLLRRAGIRLVDRPDVDLAEAEVAGEIGERPRRWRASGGPGNAVDLGAERIGDGADRLRIGGGIGGIGLGIGRVGRRHRAADVLDIKEGVGDRHPGMGFGLPA